jgi:hypothetical protein
MADKSYIYGDTVNATHQIGRQKYRRPQAMLWSEQPGVLDGGFYVPPGSEIGASVLDPTYPNSFIILSDHNRQPIDIKNNRIEKRQRMVNGGMRSYFIADKATITLSWNNLPSRAFSTNPQFNSDGVTSLNSSQTSEVDATEYTIDGGAGGNELLDWYENHTGAFYVFLAYDKYREFGTDAAAYTHLRQYNQVLKMFVTDFSYSIQKRGGSNPGANSGLDLWNVSVTLEEA